jgi:hypothetical protein
MDLRQGTIATLKMGPFKDATDGVTNLDLLTIQKAAVLVAKNGGALTATAQDQGVGDVGAPYDANGFYNIDLDTDDTDTLGALLCSIEGAGALEVEKTFNILTPNAYDSKYGTDKLQVDLHQVNNVNQIIADFRATTTTASNMVSEPDNTGIAANGVAIGNLNDFDGSEVGTVTDGAKSSTTALESTLTAMKGTGFNTAIDSLKAVRERGDLAWITGTGGGGALPGVGTVTVTILDQFTAPVIGANVRITDVVGSGNYSGGGVTDGNGEVAIDALAVGDYFIVSTANGYDIPDTPHTIIATPTTADITANKATINPPLDPNVCTLYGYVDSIQGVDKGGVDVKVKSASGEAVFVDGNGICQAWGTVTSDINGFWEMNVVKNIPVLIEINDTGYRETATLVNSTQNVAGL